MNEEGGTAKVLAGREHQPAGFNVKLYTVAAALLSHKPHAATTATDGLDLTFFSGSEKGDLA